MQIVILILVLLPSVAHAFNEPTGFKEYKFGMTAAEIMEVRARTGRGTAGLSVKESLGDVVVDTNFFYYWDRSAPTYPVQRLGMISLDFPEHSYRIIRDAFIERYGKPSETQLVTYRSAVGATFQGEVLNWKGESVSITLRQYATKRTQSSALLSTKTWSDARRVEELERAKKAAGDLK
jgi:hypothetical protein